MRCHTQKSIKDSIYLKNAINWIQPGEKCYYNNDLCKGQYWPINLRSNAKPDLYSISDDIQCIGGKGTYKFNIKELAKIYESN